MFDDNFSIAEAPEKSGAFLFAYNFHQRKVRITVYLIFLFVMNNANEKSCSLKTLHRYKATLESMVNQEIDALQDKAGIFSDKRKACDE